MGAGTLIRTLTYDYDFNNADGGTVGALLLQPKAESTVIHGEIVAVRLQFPDNQSWTLASIQVVIYPSFTNGVVADVARVLYDTGLLQDGVIPEGGTVAIDLSGNNDACFWNDTIGANRPVFHLAFGEALKVDISHTASGGVNSDNVKLEVDYKEYAA
jgi:hypothetical protein